MTQDAPASDPGKLHFAVVGAGVAGLVCARELCARGYRVTLYEARSTPGGRLSSAQTESGLCDLGTQYLTVQGEAFAREVGRWVSADLLRSWEPVLVEFSSGQAAYLQSFAHCFVGVPSMQAISDHLAQGLDIVYDAPIGRITRGSSEWYLFDPQDRPLGIVGFDGLVLAIPSIDALPLLGEHSDFAPRLQSVRWDACWSACLALSRPSGIEFDGAFITDDPILGWAARESSKPQRQLPDGVAERWVLQARASWSNNFAELPADDAARWMQRAFAARLARPMAQKFCTATRWRVGFPSGSLPESFLWDPARAIGLAGDWCGGARVEAAYLSGVALARAITG